MALWLRARVETTATIVGTGPLTNVVANTSRIDFSTMPDGDYTYGYIQQGALWEECTLTKSGVTMVRSLVTASSSGGASVGFDGTSSSTAFIDVPLKFFLVKNAAGGFDNADPLLASVTVNTVAALKAVEIPATSGLSRRTRGSVSATDGKGGWYYWDAADATAGDDYNFVVSSLSATGRWIRMRQHLDPASAANDAAISSGAIARVSGSLRSIHPINGALAIPETVSFVKAIFDSYAVFKAVASTTWANNDRIGFNGITAKNDAPYHEATWNAASTNIDALDSLFIRPTDILASNPGRAQFIEPAPIVAFADAVPTPSVKAARHFRTSNIGTTITALADAIDLQVYTIFPGLANTQFTHSATFVMPGAANFVLQTTANGGGPVQIVYENGVGYLMAGGGGGGKDALVFKGVIDASLNPNYPAANAGDVYKISVAGKIGGAAGPNVEVDDTLYCTLDGSAAGAHATVGANWSIAQGNIDVVALNASIALKAPLASPVFPDGVTVDGPDTLVKPTVRLRQAAAPTFGYDIDLESAGVGRLDVHAVASGVRTLAFSVDRTSASVDLKNIPTAPTAAPGTNTTQIATTAHVKAAGDLKAPLASPALTGTPTAPTAAPGTNTTQVANTAFVQAAKNQGVSLVSQFGVLSTIITDAAANRALLQTVIDTGKHVVVDQQGTFFFDATLTITTLGQTFSGLGSNKTTLTCTATSGPALRVKQRSVTIRDIGIWGTQARYDSVAPGMGIGLWLGPDEGVSNSMSHTTIERVGIGGHPKAGLALSAGVFQHSIIKDVLVQDCQGPGVVLDDGKYVGFVTLGDAPGILQIDILTVFHCGGEGLSVGTALGTKTPFRVQMSQLEILYCGWKASERSADAQLYIRGTTVDLDNSAFADEIGQVTNLSGWARTAKTVVGRPYVIDGADHVVINNIRQINIGTALWKTGSVGIYCLLPRHIQNTAPLADFVTEIENGVTNWFIRGRTQAGGATNFVRALSANGRYVLDDKHYLPVAADNSDLQIDATTFASRTITSGALRVFQDKNDVLPEGGVADTLANIYGGALGAIPPPAGAELVLLNISGQIITISHTLGNIRTYTGASVEWKDNQLIRLVSDGTVVRLQGQLPSKADIGLGNVDNTADTAKQVSTAQQTALNTKAPLKIAYTSQDAVEGYVVPADAHTIVFTTRTSAIITTISGANMTNGQVIDIYYRVSGLAALFQDSGVAGGNLLMRSNSSLSMGLQSLLTLKWDSISSAWTEQHRALLGGSPEAALSSSATVGTLPTPNGSVTIANAAAPTVTELLEYCEELKVKVNSALSAARIHGLIGT